MNQYILPVRDFVDLSGYVPQFSLCADIIKKYREKAGKLLDQIIYRADVAVQKSSDISREQVGILNEHAASGKVNDQARKKSNRFFWIEFNEFQPGSDIQKMSAVDLDLPVIPDT